MRTSYMTFMRSGSALVSGNATGEAGGNSTGNGTNGTSGNETDSEASTLRALAKEKLEKMIESYKGLDDHIKEQFAALEKILTDIKINVSGFDPDSEDDIAWLSGEIDKILKAAPEIKALEDKLKSVDDVHPALDKVLEDLEKITDVK
jgi:hypothetical protein